MGGRVGWGGAEVGVKRGGGGRGGGSCAVQIREHFWVAWDGGKKQGCLTCLRMEGGSSRQQSSW